MILQDNVIIITKDRQINIISLFDITNIISFKLLYLLFFKRRISIKLLLCLGWLLCQPLAGSSPPTYASWAVYCCVLCSTLPPSPLFLPPQTTFCLTVIINVGGGGPKVDCRSKHVVRGWRLSLQSQRQFDWHSCQREAEAGRVGRGAESQTWTHSSLRRHN